MAFNFGSLLGGAAGGATVAILIKAVDEYSKEINNASKGVDKLGKDVGKFSLGSKIALGAAATAFAAFAVDSTRSAITFERSLQALKIQVGDTADLLIKDLARASDGMISNLELVQTTNKALALGLQQSQLSDLMEVATARAKVMGITASQAFDDIARGIGRQSPLILDNLGIVVDLEKTYEAYALSVGKTVDQLSKAEKQFALTSSVIKEGQQFVEAYAGATDTTADRLERMNAGFENLSVSFGNFIATVEAKTGILEGAAGLLDIFAGRPQMRGEIVSQIENVLQFQAKEGVDVSLDQALKSFSERAKGFLKPEDLERLKKIEEDLRSGKDKTMFSTENETEANEKLKDAFDRLTERTTIYNKENEALQQVINRGGEAAFQARLQQIELTKKYDEQKQALLESFPALEGFIGLLKSVGASASAAGGNRFATSEEAFGRSGFTTRQVDSGAAIRQATQRLSSARGFAHGGVVTRPTLGLVGEAGPEVIRPLGQAGGLGGGVTINVYANDAEDVADKIGRIINDRMLAGVAF